MYNIILTNCVFYFLSIKILLLNIQSYISFKFLLISKTVILRAANISYNQNSILLYKCLLIKAKSNSRPVNTN